MSWFTFVFTVFKSNGTVEKKKYEQDLRIFQ